MSPPPRLPVSQPSPLSGHVVASGYYGYRNSGDEAILCVLLDQLARLGIRKTCVLTEVPERIDMLYGTEGATGVMDWEMLGVAGLKNLLRGRLFRKLGIQARARLFIFGGGSIFRDVGMSRRSVWRLLDDIFFARLLGVPIFFYALGVGPFESPRARWLFARAAHCADTITVRDEKSAALLRELGIPAERIGVVTDPAFLLPDFDAAEAARQAGLAEFLVRHPRTLFVYPTMSMAVPPLADDDRHLRAMAAGLSRLCLEDGWAVAMIPMEVLGEVEYAHGIEDDITTNRKIAAAMAPGCAVHRMEHALPPPMVRALTQLASLNVAVRLHPMIYAASFGIPCVPLNYDPKVAGNAARFGLTDYVVEFSEGWPDRMVENVRRLERNLEAERARLTAALPALQVGAVETFHRLEALLRSGHSTAVEIPASARSA